MFYPSLSCPYYPFKILLIWLYPASSPRSVVWLIQDKIYPSCGSYTDRLLPPSPPFSQVPSARTSGIIAWIHMQLILHSQFSPQNVPFLLAAVTTMHPRLDHYQLVWRTYIDQHFISCNHFASVGRYCIHSLMLVAWPQVGWPLGAIVCTCLYNHPYRQTRSLWHIHLARG